MPTLNEDTIFEEAASALIQYYLGDGITADIATTAVGYFLGNDAPGTPEQMLDNQTIRFGNIVEQVVLEALQNHELQEAKIAFRAVLDGFNGLVDLSWLAVQVELRGLIL